MLATHQLYMQRCLQLAKKGMGNVAPNPMVGSVLVYNNIVIGEGWHQQFGQPHAEVNCINSVSQKNKHLIPLATLYVSLEPCNHFGKTPPCSHLIVQQKIKKVVIGCRDSFALVNGAGIAYLNENGVEVEEGVLEKECLELNKRFFTFHTKKRPFVVLKFAQTADGFIGNENNNRLLISNAITQQLVHKWRSNEAAILVGAATVIKDNPQLNNRLHGTKQPQKIVIANNTVLPENAAVFNGQPVWVFTATQQNLSNSSVIKLHNTSLVIQQVLAYCHTNNIQSIMVEGGAFTLKQFIQANVWDEAIIITNKNLQIGNGIKAPILQHAALIHTQTLQNDSIDHFTNTFTE